MRWLRNRYWNWRLTRRPTTVMLGPPGSGAVFNLGPIEDALRKAKVGLVGSLRHPYRTCNGDDVEKCFVCEGLKAIEEGLGEFSLLQPSLHNESSRDVQS